MNMKKTLALVLTLLITLPLFPQKVGLVLSGGGAKGVAHIGAIKALEENEIPIDYVVGTSMGAIVGSLYCMGYTPEEMLQLILSDKFQTWYQGEQNLQNQYFYMQNDPTPAIASMQFNLKDSMLLVRPQNTSLVNPLMMNLGVIDLYAGGNAACHGDFDELMVPFRSVGSDIYNKRKIVMSSGDLGNSVRASMTFPFVFKPIKIDGTLVYDGGIYDNYPFDVMIEEFAPDIIIGCEVTGQEDAPDDDNMYGQLRSMIIQDMENDIPDSLGISINMRMNDIKLLDFKRANQIFNRGYFSTIHMIDSIKSRVTARRPLEAVNVSREKFRSAIPDILFNKIEITGVNASQATYLEREFRQEIRKTDLFDFNSLCKGYDKLLSDDVVREISPYTYFNEEDSTYTLGLDVSLDNKPRLHIGGGLSTSATSQIYAGISYNYVNIYSLKTLIEGQVGRSYNNAQLSVRFDMAQNHTQSFVLKAGFSNFNYYNQKYIFNNSDNPAFNKYNEFFIKLKASMPFLVNQKAEISIGAATRNDYYLQDNKYIYDFKYNTNKYNILGASAKLVSNTLNTPQYPTKGFCGILQADIYTSADYERQRYDDDFTYIGANSWIQTSLTAEHYATLSKHMVLGNYARLYYSFRDLASNYSATMMQAGAFEPTVNSKFVFNNIFRANKYVAYGIKPIFIINRYLHLRSEFYGFLPFSPICYDEDSTPYYGKTFSQISFLGEISLVATYSRISANLFVNISGDTNRFDAPSFGVTLGILMPGERFFE